MQTYPKPSLLGGESEANGNTTSAPSPFTPVGSASEASRGETPGVPGPVVPAPTARTTVVSSGTASTDPWRATSPAPSWGAS